VVVGLTPALKYCIATVYISLPQLSGHCDLCCVALHDHCGCRSHSSCVATMDIGLISCGALCDHCKCKSHFSCLSTVDLVLTVAVWWSLAVGLSYAARLGWLLSCSNCVATVGVALTLAVKHNVAIVYVSFHLWMYHSLELSSAVLHYVAIVDEGLTQTVCLPWV
jgi:hypothetical protein